MKPCLFGPAYSVPGNTSDRHLHGTKLAMAEINLPH